MPPMRFRLVFALILALALSACAPKGKTASPSATAKASAAPAQAGSTPINKDHKGFRVVMGQPLPAAKAPNQAAAPSQATAAGQAVAPAPAAAQAGIPMQPAAPAQAGIPMQPATAIAAPVAAASSGQAASPVGSGQAFAATPAPAMGQAPALGAPAGQAPALGQAPIGQSTTPLAGQVPGTAPEGMNQATPGSAPPGYGGLSWGDSAKTFPGLAVYETDKATGVTTCLWPQGPKDIYGAPIRDAYYEFFKDRFYHVWIEYDGMAAYKTALEGLKRAYGPPTQEIPEKYYHAWTLGDVNIYCAFHPAENGGDVSFFYQPIYEPMMAARKAQAKTAPRSRKP